ncbi:putative tRNA pseudouridine synthase 2 [Tupaia chinensis]|uniref:Putative tRNA pseudouridine synthase 2 n=1 Tax=Tupaia chinensis TaxID=246437 RepID=L9KGJ5_TUPCH|nr:putative tRNA pseudouridine synthase 2 [Tupaia chinensis]
MGSAGLARLHGLFAVYKPPGLKWKHLRDTVELQLLKGLNAGKPPAPEQRVRFLLSSREGNEKELTLTATSVPALTNHPLVLGVGRGCRLLTDMYDAHLTKDYTVHGILGKATDDFREDGRLVEKTTYDHVTRGKLDRVLAVIQGSHQKALVMYSNLDLKTQEAYEMAVRGLIRPRNKSPMLAPAVPREVSGHEPRTPPHHVTRGKLDRVLAVIQGSHQKALVMYSNLDLKTQEAYEMAVRGLIRPRNKSPMLVTGIQCCHFAPPEFVLEVQCLHETPQQLRRLVHEVGLELKTSAVCSQVRRTRDGFFTLDDALLRTHWDLHSIQDAIQAAAPRVAAELEKSLRPGLGTQQLSGPDQPWDSEDTSATLGLETHAGH